MLLTFLPLNVTSEKLSSTAALTVNTHQLQATQTSSSVKYYAIMQETITGTAEGHMQSKSKASLRFSAHCRRAQELQRDFTAQRTCSICSI